MKKVNEKAKPKAAPKKIGRPSVYTKEKGDAVIALLEQGVWITEACRQMNVALSSWIRWVHDDVDDLSERSARAREQCYDVMAMDTLRIADELPLIQPISGALDGASVQHKRLQIDTRFRLLSKLCPDRYSDRTKIEHSGKIGLEDLITGASDEPASN